MALVLPDGAQVTFTLPPYSYLPGLTQAERDVADLVVAATNTSYFPEARESHFNLINKRLAATFNSGPGPRGPNRRARRAAGKKRGK